MLKEIYGETKSRMGTTVEAIRKELATIRTGRASLSVLDGIMVNWHGADMPINQVAKLSVPDASLIIANPYDKSIIQDIVKAIQQADIGLNPMSDGKVIRIPIPPLTEETRKTMAKKVKEVLETGKTSVRNIRREMRDQVAKLQKEKNVSEDEEHDAYDRIQEMTDEHVKELDEIAAKKEKEIMEV